METFVVNLMLRNMKVLSVKKINGFILLESLIMRVLKQKKN